MRERRLRARAVLDEVLHADAEVFGAADFTEALRFEGDAVRELHGGAL